MTRKLQILRGTTAQNNAYTGAVGELTMDTDRNEVRIHDGQTVGGIKIGDRNMPILTSMFFDHITNDMSWLRADTFSWQSGDVYVAAYEHLANDSVKLYAWASGAVIYYTLTETPAVGDNVYSGNVNDDPSQIENVDNGTITFDDPRTGVQKVATRDATGDSNSFVLRIGLKTDTIDGITITYSLAEDGHKICLPDQESNLIALYEATGVAWYYILDTENKQFKLPRTQWGFTGLRDSVGGYVEAGLPNITAKFRTGSWKTDAVSANTSGAASQTYGSGAKAYEGGSNAYTYVDTTIDASASDPTYQDGATVQPPATQMYLYFYVGDFEQSATEQTAGLNAELFNNKADRNLLNTTDNVDIVIESQLPTADNGYTWYRKYKSGWVEQGGATSGSTSSITITFPVVMADANYTAVLGNRSGVYEQLVINTRSTTNMVVNTTVGTGSAACFWQVSGMSAQ